MTRGPGARYCSGMKVEPIGLPVALKAWRSREPEPVLTLHCGADPACGTEVGAVYRSPPTVVVESRITVPEEPAERPSEPAVPRELAELAYEIDMPGLFADAGFPLAPAGPPEATVRAQIDVLFSERNWHDPTPVCPEHGALRLDREALAEAVRGGATTYAAQPA